MKVKYAALFVMSVLLFTTSAIYFRNKSAKPSKNFFYCLNTCHERIAEEAFYSYNRNKHTKPNSQSAEDFFYRIKYCRPKCVKTANSCYIYRRTTCIEQNEYEKAIKIFTDAIKRNPLDANLYFSRGLIYIAMGDFDGFLIYPGKAYFKKAISDLTKATELNSKLAEAYSNRGSAYDQIGESLLAKYDFDKAIMLDPMDETLYMYRATFYFVHDDSDSSIPDYEKALKLKPWDAEAYNKLLYYDEY